MHSTYKQLFTAKAVDGISELENVDNSRHLVVAIDTESSAELTVKIKGSVQNTPPDFDAAQSPTNQWAYLQLKDLDTGSTINGSTGVVASGTDINNMYEVNTNGVKYVAAEVASRTVGAVSVGIRAFNEGN